MQRNDQLALDELDLDTGKPTIPGEYGLADQTYSNLVITLQTDSFAYLTPPLKENIMHFYASPDSTTKSNQHKKDKIDWQHTFLALQQLRLCKAKPIDSIKFPVDSVVMVKGK